MKVCSLSIHLYYIVQQDPSKTLDAEKHLAATEAAWSQSYTGTIQEILACVVCTVHNPTILIIAAHSQAHPVRGGVWLEDALQRPACQP